VNPRLASIPGSLIREMNARKQPGDIDLGLGEPLLKPDAALLAEAAAWAADQGCRYGPNAGLVEVREALARVLGGSGADRLVLTNGSQEAIYLAIKTLCDPARDEVLVVEPSYPLYRKIAQLEGISQRGVSMPGDSGFAFDAEAVLAAVRAETKLVIVCSPCNPTGRTFGAEGLCQLAEGLARLPDPPHVLVDEAYRELYFTADPPLRFQEVYPRTLVAGSLSKSNALTGLRLGWLFGPPDVVGPAAKVHQFILTSANVVGQRVAQLLAERGQLGVYREHYAGRKAAFCKALEKHGLKGVEPEGAFYAMVALAGAWTGRSLDAARQLVDAFGVVTIPGVAFGDAAEGWLRCSFVAEPDDLDRGAARIAAFLRGEPGLRGGMRERSAAGS
jgi:aspartate/methionine/tyrosine aminotransferase